MKSGVTFAAGDLLTGLRKLIAERLLAAAEELREEHKERLNIPNPPPHLDSSRPGEYPRRRTGVGRESVIVAPDDTAAVSRTLTTRVGHTVEALYMNDLLRSGRLGLWETTQDILPVLREIVTEDNP